MQRDERSAGDAARGRVETASPRARLAPTRRSGSGALRRASGCEHRRRAALATAGWRRGVLSPDTRTGRGSTHSRALRACARRRRSGRAGSASGARCSLNSSGVNLSSLRSTSTTSLPGARPVRLATRKMCVSTAIVGCAERDVQHDVGGLAADAGQRLQRLAVARHLAAVLAHEDLARARRRSSPCCGRGRSS